LFNFKELRKFLPNFYRASVKLQLKVMDRGVMGVQVPHINTAEDARQVVEAVKFYPLGKRGLAAGTRPCGYGFDESMDQFVQTSNKETLTGFFYFSAKNFIPTPYTKAS